MRYRERFTAAPLPRVAVYRGAGASHSWTWLAELLDRLGLFDTSFLDERDILAGRLGEFDALLVGGGDTYEIAGALGPVGAGEVERFVRAGGRYFGSCAGAYLVLTGVDLPPFDPFNLVEGGMLNFMEEPPPPRCLEHKYLAPYGRGWVFHPVYGEVDILDLNAGSVPGGGAAVRTVLFGGPVLQARGASRVAAEFCSLTARAAFLWPREAADGLVLGKPAALECSLGEGMAMVSGPHLEHPLFPAANCIVARFLSGAERRGAGAPGSGKSWSGDVTGSADDALLDLRRALSNARIVAFGLEKMPVWWKIGVKVWEPEKIRLFLECAWRRLPELRESFSPGGAPRRVPPPRPDGLAGLAQGYAGLVPRLKELEEKVEAGKESSSDAASLLADLGALTAGFLSLYFSLRLEERL